MLFTFNHCYLFITISSTTNNFNPPPDRNLRELKWKQDFCSGLKRKLAICNKIWYVIKWHGENTNPCRMWVFECSHVVKGKEEMPITYLVEIEIETVPIQYSLNITQSHNFLKHTCGSFLKCMAWIHRASSPTSTYIQNT